MTTGVRCIDCKQFIRKQARCPVSDRRQPVYQNAFTRNCSQFQPDTGNLFISDYWQPKPETISDRWHVAINGRNQIEYFTILFPKVVSFMEAQKEAARHWEAFYLRVG